MIKNCSKYFEYFLSGCFVIKTQLEKNCLNLVDLLQSFTYHENVFFSELHNSFLSELPNTHAGILDSQHKMAICAIYSVKIKFVGSKQSLVSILPKRLIQLSII